MPRVPSVRREELGEAGQTAWDEIAESRTRVSGPFGVLLHSPELAVRTARLGAYVRYHPTISNRWRHLITMIASRAQDSQYEFTVHANLAREEGIPDAVVDAIDRGEEPDPALLEGIEPIIVAFAHQLATVHRVDDVVFDAVREAIGLQGLTDVLGTFADFSMIAFALNAFEVEVRAGQTPRLTIHP
jgi:4-carboxymuconolactone decarboxylase